MGLSHAQEFVNLGIHTPFELLNGSFSLTDWIKKAKYLGQSALGICDYNTMAATLILQKECEAAPKIGWNFPRSLASMRRKSSSFINRQTFSFFI